MIKRTIVISQKAYLSPKDGQAHIKMEGWNLEDYGQAIRNDANIQRADGVRDSSTSATTGVFLEGENSETRLGDQQWPPIFSLW